MITNVGERGSAEFTVAPGSAPDDGQLDVVVQRSDTAAAMVRMIWALQPGPILGPTTCSSRTAAPSTCGGRLPFRLNATAMPPAAFWKRITGSIRTR
jgi:hypothetical protein